MAQRCLPGYPIASGSLTIASPRFRRCCGRPAYVPVDARTWVVVLFFILLILIGLAVVSLLLI